MPIQPDDVAELLEFRTVNCRLLGGRRGREGLHQLLAAPDPPARDIWGHLLSTGDIPLDSEFSAVRAFVFLSAAVAI